MSKEEILKKHCANIHFERPDDTFSNVLEAMNAYADQRVSEALNGQWVKCSERLPEYMQTVVIHSKTGFVTQAQFGGGKRPMFSVGGQEWIEADFWQPLPSPPLKP